MKKLLQYLHTSSHKSSERRQVVMFGAEQVPQKLARIPGRKSEFERQPLGASGDLLYTVYYEPQ